LLEEGLDPWRGLGELWIMGPGDRPHFEDISATVDRKIAALLCHASQVGEDAERIETWMRERWAELGQKAGYDFAESFQVIGQGPGFHADEVEEDVDMAAPPVDPASSPVRKP